MFEARRTLSAIVITTAPLWALESHAHAATTPTSGSAVPVVRCDGKIATIVGTDRNDILKGTPRNDVIVAGAGNDTIYGFRGNDTICGWAGADVIAGGPGDDRLFGGTNGYGRQGRYTGDTVAPGPGDDYVDLGAPSTRRGLEFVDYRDAWRGVTVDLKSRRATGEGTDTFTTDTISVYGSTHDDLLSGTEHGELLLGQGGTDHLVGLDGPDLLDDGDEVAQGSDLLEGGSGNDGLEASGDGDRLFGGSGLDSISTYGGVVAHGGDGDDSLTVDDRGGARLYGDGGADQIFASHTGDERVFLLGGTGDDRLYVQAGVGNLSGGPGAEFIGSTDAEAAVAWVDHIDAGPGPDTIKAGVGDDVIDAGPGADDVDGGRGTDRGTAGPGIDRCVDTERVESCEDLT